MKYVNIFTRLKLCHPVNKSRTIFNDAASIQLNPTGRIILTAKAPSGFVATYKIITDGVAVNYLKFFRIHSVKSALYGFMTMRAPLCVDDEEVLAKLFAFSATLTPLF